MRHALFQKWFLKLSPTSGMYEMVWPTNFFWGLNYSNRSDRRPRQWQMPRELPQPFLLTDNEGEQRNDEASTVLSSHLNTEPPSEMTTVLLPSAFCVKLEHELFPPPEPRAASANCLPSSAASSCR